MDTTAVNIITDMTKEQMQYWLVRFVLEVRKKCGDVYPPNSLHHNYCCWGNEACAMVRPA